MVERTRIDFAFEQRRAAYHRQFALQERFIIAAMLQAYNLLEHTTTIFVRFVFAFILGALFDCLALGEFRSYAERMGPQPYHDAVKSAFWAILLFLFVFLCSFMLNFRTPSTLRIGFTVLIPLLVLAGIITTHTVVIIRDGVALHNLFPFEYVGLLFLGIPAFIGAILALVVSLIAEMLRRRRLRQNGALQS
jgi:hypothetical protein